MENDLFNNELDLLKTVGKYAIKFGILSEDEDKKETVTLYNLDETVNKVEMSVRDIMYFTENGTITIPSKSILNTIYKKIDIPVSIVLQNIVDDIFSGSLTNEGEIDARFRSLVNDINSTYIRQGINDAISNDNFIENLIDGSSKNKSIFDLNRLSKYIKCELIIKN